jgi:hypothetical protein
MQHPADLMAGMTKHDRLPEQVDTVFEQLTTHERSKERDKSSPA